MLKSFFKDKTAAGLGMSILVLVGNHFPLKQGRLQLVLFGSLSTKTGDSPYEIGIDDCQLVKVIILLVRVQVHVNILILLYFYSVSASYGWKESGLNQLHGSRILESLIQVLWWFFFWFAYSFNYDVYLTMSYQQSFNTAKFYFKMMKVISLPTKVVLRCLCLRGKGFTWKQL